MDKIAVIDFRDEFYVKLYRGWVVISVMGGNAKFKEGVPIGKAALVDFLLCNPIIQRELLNSFGRVQQRLNLEDFLYRDNIEFGNLQSTREFATTCSLLIKCKFISLTRSNGEVMLQSILSPPEDAPSLAVRWRQEIAHLLPLMGKSLNVLHGSILKATNGIQPLPYSPAVDRQGKIEALYFQV